MLRPNTSGPTLKAVQSSSGGVQNLARRQQMQLLGYGRNQILKNPHLFFQFVAFSLPLTVRDQTLYRISGKVGDTAGAPPLTHAAKLSELVFRDPEVY